MKNSRIFEIYDARKIGGLISLQNKIKMLNTGA